MTTGANRLTTAALQRGDDLAGKVALFTGASGNLGRALGLSLASGGAAIAVNARASRDAADKVAAEIAAAVRFLCGPSSSFMTGQTLHVNGGQMML